MVILFISWHANSNFKICVRNPKISILGKRILNINNIIIKLKKGAGSVADPDFFFDHRVRIPEEKNIDQKHVILKFSEKRFFVKMCYILFYLNDL